jgi:hypothetical protein
MKRIGYAGLFLLAGIVFPLLIWVAAVVAVRKMWLARRVTQLVTAPDSNPEPDYPGDAIPLGDE